MQKNQDSRLGTENITKLMISLAIPADADVRVVN